MSENLPVKRQLPSLTDIYADKALAIQINDLNKILNAKPKKEWIRQHPLAKKVILVQNPENPKELVKQEVPVEYIPIERVEYLLTVIYLKWRKEIKTVQLIANSIVVTLRLWVLDPITGEWDWQEGVGAAPIRTKKGASATDFSQIQDSSVQTGAPAAESYALKDAAEGFGTIFGSDINRKEDIDYQAMQAAKFKNVKLDIPEELLAVIDEKESPEELVDLFNANNEYHSNPEFMKRIMARTEKLRAEKEAGNG